MRTFLLSGLFLIFLAAAPHASWTQTSSPATGKTLVVYYSREGHTRLVAEKLAQKFSADVQELIDRKKRIGPVAVTAAGKDAVAGHLTQLEPLAVNVQEYDLILIGTPSWFGNITPAVRTFIVEHDLSGKKIGLFGTTHLTGIEAALAQAAALIHPAENHLIPTLPLRHRDLPEDILRERIRVFYEQFE